MNASRTLLRRQIPSKRASSICWQCRQTRSYKQTRPIGAELQQNRSPRAPSSVGTPRRPAEIGALPPLGPPERENELQANGIPGLYTGVGLQKAWYIYQDDLITKLNDWLTRGDTAHLGKDVKGITINTARLPQYAAYFNYASMIHNNHFFFESINLDGTKSQIPGNLSNKIQASFQSPETLREEFLTTAHAMFGPGFVWLVLHDDRSSTGNYLQKKLSILTTYLAGTPFAKAHNRFQPHDMNTQSVNDMARDPRYAGAATNSVGMFGAYANRDGNRRAYGGVDVTPILCVNTWPQAWMFDWEVNAEGKWQFLQSWWDRINWEQVNRRLEIVSR